MDFVCLCITVWTCGGFYLNLQIKFCTLACCDYFGKLNHFAKFVYHTVNNLLLVWEKHSFMAIIHVWVDNYSNAQASPWSWWLTEMFVLLEYIFTLQWSVIMTQQSSLNDIHLCTHTHATHMYNFFITDRTMARHSLLFHVLWVVSWHYMHT